MTSAQLCVTPFVIVVHAYSVNALLELARINHFQYWLGAGKLFQLVSLIKSG